MTALDLRTLNAAAPADFVAAMAPLFEGAPRFLARLAAERPFDDWDGLFEVARAIARVMPEVEQVELIDAHPRLGAPPGSMSVLSSREQGHALAGRPAASDRDPGPTVDPGVGADPGGTVDPGARGRTPVEDPVLAAELERLNEAYEHRFGFRYCVFVAGRPRATLLPEMAAALHATRDAELRRALDAVVDIARARRRALADGS